MVVLSVGLDIVQSRATALQNWLYPCRRFQHKMSCKVVEEQMVDSCCVSHLSSSETARVTTANCPDHCKNFHRSLTVPEAQDAIIRACEDGLLAAINSADPAGMTL